MLRVLNKQDHPELCVYVETDEKHVKPIAAKKIQLTSTTCKHVDKQERCLNKRKGR